MWHGNQVTSPTSPHPHEIVPIPTPSLHFLSPSPSLLMNIIATNNLHILLLLVMWLLMYCKLITFYNNHVISVHKTNYPHFLTCHAMYQYYSVKCIIPICIFTAITTDKSYSCPHYCGYTANSIPIPTVPLWLLPPFLQEYRHHCPHYHGNDWSYRGIIAVPIPMSLFNQNNPSY